MSSCTGTQRNETLTNCVTTPCMDMKTIGIPPCTSTPGQPQNPYGQLHFLQNYSIPVSRLFIHLSNFIAQLKLFFLRFVSLSFHFVPPDFSATRCSSS